MEKVRGYYLTNFVAFVEQLLYPFDFGPDMVLTDWHKERLLEIEDSIRCQTPKTLDLWFRGGFKAVDCEEPVFTTSGWKRHGDLKQGDQVFGPDGKPCDVVGRSETFYHDDCYRVTLDNGYSVVVNGDHLWAVERKCTRRCHREEVILSTTEMAKNDHAPDNRYAIRATSPIQMPHASTLIDPYVLGVWLGDGSRGKSQVSCGDQDVDEMTGLIEEAGYRVRRVRERTCWRLTLGDGVRGNRALPSFKADLRRFGVLERKHIPDKCMLWSFEQRLSLLQGLMDTDGHARPGASRAVFVSSSEELAYDTWELAASLGLKPSIRRYDVECYGKVRPRWHISFQTCSTMPVFRLRRKAERSSDIERKRRFFITAVERVPSRPTNCIKVDREDGKYLISKHFITTHNTVFISRYSNLWRLFRDPALTILMRHGDAGKAEKILGNLKKHLLLNPYLREVFPEFCPERGTKKWGRTDEFNLPNSTNHSPEPSMRAVGIEANITGDHYKHVSDDDIENEVNVNTKETRAKLIRKWEDTSSILCRPPVYKGTHAMVGTPWHAAGLWLGHVVPKFGPDSEAPAEEKIVYRFHPACLPDLTPLAPEVMSREMLEAEAFKQGPYKFSANMLLKPTDPGTAIFKEEWIQHYDFPHTHDKYSKRWVPDCQIRRVMTLDLAQAVGKQVDCVGYLIVDIDHMGRWFIREAYENRIDSYDLINLIFRKQETWDLDLIYVDSVANQAYFSKWAMREAEDRKIRLPMIPVKLTAAGQAAKERRIMSVATRWANGLCYIVSGCEGGKTLQESMVNYPAVGNDDLLDAMAQLDQMEAKGRGRPREPYPGGSFGWWQKRSKEGASPSVGSWWNDKKRAEKIRFIRRAYGK